MTTCIEIYPSSLPGEPIERHHVPNGRTLHDWLTEHCPGYQIGPQQPISASIDGGLIPPESWDALVFADQTIEIRPNARGIEWVIAGVALLIGVAVAVAMKPAASRTQHGRQGSDLMMANLQANTPKLNQVIPEIAGKYRIYPDYLCQPRRYFIEPRRQAIDVMLSVGMGEYQINHDDILIGETKIGDLGNAVSYQIYSPGADVSGFQSHRNWYNAPEVGRTVGSAGLRMAAGQAAGRYFSASSYVIDGESIIVPIGSGMVPQTWEVGMTISVSAMIMTVTVIDGGRSGFFQMHDKLRGPFAGLGLSVGDDVGIMGLPTGNGRYVVHSITDIGNGDLEIELDNKYITTSLILGGTAAGSFPVGTHNNVELYRPSGSSAFDTPQIGLFIGAMISGAPTRYKIASVITEDVVNDGVTQTIIIGWNLLRLLPNGDIDPSWVGFSSNTTTSHVNLFLDSSTSVYGGWLGPFRATPAQEYATKLEIDVFAPGGLGYVNDDGDIMWRSRRIDVQWRSSGGLWTSVVHSVGGASRDQLGWTFEIELPEPCRDVDVRVRRIGAEDLGIRSMDRIEWYGLKSLLDAPTQYDGITTMALTLRGSDVIAERTENQINMIVTRKLDGVPTRSIAPWMKYVCQSIGYGSNDINDAELDALAAVWDARGETFDLAIVEPTTVRDAINSALRAGFAELSVDRGQIRPVRDHVRTVFEHMYTPQNMTSPLRRQTSAYGNDDYDGVDVEYVDSVTWKREVVHCRLPGDIGIRVEKITVDGVTNRTMAWRIGMRRRRSHVYQRKTYSFTTEWDALNSRYLSYCAVADDIPGYGQSSLLLSYEQGSGSVTLHASDVLHWEEGKNHIVALRRPDGTIFGPHPAMREGDSSVSINAELDFDPVVSGVQDRTHILHGTVDRWSYPVLITSINPSSNGVNVSGVNYDARVYLDDDNSPPEY